MNPPRAISVPAIVVVIAISAIYAVPQTAKQAVAPQALQLNGDVKFTHDPSIIKAGDTWYVFSTNNGNDRAGEMQIRCSSNLHDWKRCGFVLEKLPSWIKETSPGTRELWAPDISYFDGKYHLYYSFSLFGKNTSGIALLTNTTLDQSSPAYRWVDEGLVLRSRAEDNFNAIDPNLVMDQEGNAWLAFGSFWTGIKMVRIDRKTGKRADGDTRIYSLATRAKPAKAEAAPPGLPANWQAIEAPSIIRHGDYFYLFASFDLCCRGLKSTYKVAVGRSKAVTGPYIDRNGKPMLEGGGTILLSGNNRWLGPGGQTAFEGKDGDLLVFHSYDANTGEPFLKISTIAWQDGWPRVAMEGGVQ